MRRVLMCVALAIGSVGLFPPSAWGCSCATTSLQQQLRAADIAFTGTVVTVDQRAGRLIARLEVATAYKGTVRRIEDVHTAASSSACGIAFSPGKRYTVFATSSRDVTTASLCSVTTDDADIVQRLKLASPIPLASGALPSRPMSPEKPSVWLVWMAGALAITSGALLIVYRIRTSRRAVTG